MADQRYDKLVGAWRAGLIDDEKLKRGLVLLHSISTQSDADTTANSAIVDEPARAAELPKRARRPAKLLASRRGGWAPSPRWMLKVGVSSFAAALVCLLIGLLSVWLFNASDGGRRLMNPGAAAGWTVLIVAANGVIVGYKPRPMAFLAAPIFLALLVAPLWNDKPSRGSVTGDIGRTPVSMFSRTVTQEEFGSEWPFPSYQSGLLRCDVATLGSTKRPLVTIELGGQKFGLNGAAQSFGYPDSRSQMAKHPEWGTYELGASDKMIASALAECG